jgi:hypothetical protein
MKRCSKCKEIKYNKEFSKNKNNKDGYHIWCKFCVIKYYLINKNKILEYRRNYYKKHKKEELVRCKNYYKNNIKKILKKQKKYNKNNRKERLNYSKKHYKDNKSQYRARTAKYKACKLCATPKWLTKEQLNRIKEFYKNCPKGYHVDHIVPLQGKNVCGLHVPWNLQYLTANKNRIKANKI